jgi:hypothetical protein
MLRRGELGIRAGAGTAGGTGIVWTKAQGDAMCARLDDLPPLIALYTCCVSFRYARGRVHAVPAAVVLDHRLEQYPAQERDSVLVLLSAHSLPLNVIDRGDAYPAEIAASVSRVVQAAEHRSDDHAVGGSRAEAHAGGADRLYE